MRVGIFTNLHKDVDLSVTNLLLNELKEKGVSYALFVDLKGKVDGEEFFDTDKPFDCDAMVTVGGDGTILRIAKYCAVNSIPIAGLNLGYTGFLAEEEPSKVSEFVENLRLGNYKLENRALLCAEVGKNSYLALNDVLVTRNFTARMLETDVFVNDEFVDRYFCDGYIVSTPTGSTAYSLSAGGSILAPNVSAFILTSINSHSLHSRPIVVSQNDEIYLSPACDANVVIDGVAVADIKKGEKLKVTKYGKEVCFIRFNGHSFYKKLLTKLNKWSVTDDKRS